MKKRIPAQTLHRYDQASGIEWLETNGLGGYASSTVIGAHTRRYHGLLVAAAKPPVQRMVMLSRLDESLIIGQEHKDLASIRYRNTVFPNGYIFQQGFERDLFPVFEYAVNGIRLRKTIAGVHGENTTLVLYEVLEAEQPFTLQLNPLYSPRDFHQLSVANDQISKEVTFRDGWFHTQAYPGVPDLYLQIPGASYHHCPDWHYQFEYQQELERGMEGHEDLFSPGRFYVEMESGSRLGIIVSTEDPTDRDAWHLFGEESSRRQELLTRVTARETNERGLVLAADQFVVERRPGGRSIIAGYHWFNDWGRDSMIALPGLCLATNRPELAREILQTFIDHLNEGLLPNAFSPDGDGASYNSIDASLWFFIAAYAYHQSTGDTHFLQRVLLPAMKHIIKWYRQGTHYGIKVEDDGLISAEARGLQLTWMDAKVDDWVVTPRGGKTVEVNALWYNALRIYAQLKRAANPRSRVRPVLELADTVKASFWNTFWYEEGGYLFDCVRKGEPDYHIRPNQLLALSLPFPLVEDRPAEGVLKVIERHLLTIGGLRTLSPEDDLYIGRYIGNVRSRDAAYHQGTVWAWLMGPYIDALVRVRGLLGKEIARRLILTMLEKVPAGCMGSISEIFDGDSPFSPRGCVAQAWSVAEILRVVRRYGLLSHEERPWELEPHKDEDKPKRVREKSPSRKSVEK